MKRFELPVKFLDMDPEEADKYEELGIELPKRYKDEILKIFPHALMGYNEDSEGDTTVRLLNGEAWKVYMTINDFENMIDEIDD